MAGSQFGKLQGCNVGQIYCIVAGSNQLWLVPLSCLVAMGLPMVSTSEEPLKKSEAVINQIAFLKNNILGYQAIDVEVH